MADHSEPNKTGRMTTIVVITLFFLSGATGLGYQVLWSKFLLDFIGVSAYSYATVLASFMGGLALGGWLFGRLADRFRSPLKLYAFLELGVAAYAITYLPLMRLSSSIYGHWVEYSPDYAGAGLGIWAKVLVSGLLLIPPTLLMGGTLPAMVRHATENMGVVGRRTSQLYAINAFGAAVGSLSMAFILMPVLGMVASLMSLALANAGIGAAAYLLAGLIGPVTAASANDSDDHLVKTEIGVPSLRIWQIRLGLALIFTAGVASFNYEIAWTRFFGVMLGSSTYSFAVMLAAFIMGISGGSAILARYDARIDNPVQFFGWTQILAGLLVILPLPLYPYVPWVFEQYASLLSAELGAFYLYEFGKLLLCFLVMLPPTLFIGMSIPLLVKGLCQSMGRLGQDTGRVYAWNTWGNVLGALLAGLVLLPLLGMERLLGSTAFFSAGLGAAAVAAFSPFKPRGKRWMHLAAPVSATAIVLLCHVVPRPWDQRWFVLEAFRRDPLTFQATKDLLADREVVLFEDDPAAHLVVTRRPLPERNNEILYSLYVNGKPDASSVGDMPTQLLSAHIPLLLHPDPKEVMIIGLASGITAGAALKHDVERVDVVELVQAMPKAARFFLPWNDDPFSDSRFNLILDDARSYVSYTKHKYDVIISEPSNPWMAGTGALFSRDYYERAARALGPNGLYLQWMQAYEIGDETLAAMIRSFRKTFPYVYGFQGGLGDILLLGCRQPIEPDWADVRRRFEQEPVRRDLKKLDIVELRSLLYFQWLSPATADFIASLTHLENTDDNHLLEYRAPRDLFQETRSSLYTQQDERMVSSPSLFWNQWIRKQGKDDEITPTLEVLSREEVRFEPLLRLWRMTYFHSRLKSGGAPVLELSSYLPFSFWNEKPLTVEQITGRVDRLLDMGQGGLAYLSLESSLPVILLQSALSAEAGAWWIDRVESWSQEAGGGSERAFQAALVDILGACGRDESLVAELFELMDSHPPPRADWAILRGCRVSDRVCTTLVKRYLDLNSVPWLERFAALRSLPFSSND